MQDREFSVLFSVPTNKTRLAKSAMKISRALRVLKREFDRYYRVRIKPSDLRKLYALCSGVEEYKDIPKMIPVQFQGLPIKITDINRSPEDVISRIQLANELAVRMVGEQPGKKLYFATNSLNYRYRCVLDGSFDIRRTSIKKILNSAVFATGDVLDKTIVTEHLADRDIESLYMAPVLPMVTISTDNGPQRPEVWCENVVFGDGPEDNIDMIVIVGSSDGKQMLSVGDFISLPDVWVSDVALESDDANMQPLGRIERRLPPIFAYHLPAFQRPPTEPGLYKLVFDEREIYCPYNTINS